MIFIYSEKREETPDKIFEIIDNLKQDLLQVKSKTAIRNLILEIEWQQEKLKDYIIKRI